MRHSLRVDEIAQQIFESMHAVEKGDVGTEWQELLEVAGGEKLIGRHLEQMKHPLASHDVSRDDEARIDADAGAGVARGGMTRFGADLEVGAGFERRVQRRKKVQVGKTVEGRIRTDVLDVHLISP